MSSSQTSSWISNALLLAGAGAVAYLILSLAMENRDLKAQLAQLHASPLETSLAAGDPVPAVALTAPDAQSRELASLTARGGVVAFLTTTCPYCKETLPSWREVESEYDERGVPFVWVSLHDSASTAIYAAEHAIESPLWVLTDPTRVADLSVASVPFTVLVGASGKISRVWLGPLSESDVAHMVAVLDGELSESRRLLSGSPATDPDCCQSPAFVGTDAEH